MNISWIIWSELKGELRVYIAIEIISKSQYIHVK